VSHEFEIRVAYKIDNVSFTAGIQIVDTENVLLVLQKPFTQMGAEKAGPAGYCTSFPKMHGCFPHNLQIVSVSFKSGRLFRTAGTGAIIPVYTVLTIF
jgi:hypothetical protein